MKSNVIHRVVAAVSAVVLNITCATPAGAQVKAALTRDVDRPSAQPVNATCSTFTLKCTLYAVPAGKRLVVETVGYQASTASGASVFEIVFGQDADNANTAFALSNVFDVSPVFVAETGGIRFYNGSQPLKMYIDEGKRLAAGIYFGGPPSYQQFFSFSGFLVDK